MRVLCLWFAVLLPALPLWGQTSPRLTGDVVPGADWQQASPESLGFSSAKLEALRAWVKAQDTGSMMVIVQGRVLFSYGDVARTSKIASVRKSILGMVSPYSYIAMLSMIANSKCSKSCQ